MPSLQKQLTIKAHAERVTGVAWHPEASTTGAGLGGHSLLIARLLGEVLRVTEGGSMAMLAAGALSAQSGVVHHAWSPACSSPCLTPGRMEAAVTLASGATDATAKLWSGDGKLLRTLTGHTDRLGRIAFHPMGRHLGEICGHEAQLTLQSLLLGKNTG